MKVIIFILTGFLLLNTACTSEKKQISNKTQAVLGIKEGGEWKWVTKNNGNEQWEYQGGTFHQVTHLKVDEKHTDHSFDIQIEGPGWESDKIGYRLYLDWRNATDIFGKKTDSLVLQKVGLDGFDSYHEMQSWGVDVLKVGSSLGIGTLAFWDGEKAVRVEKTDSIICDVKSGENESNVNVNYFGWEIDSIKTDLKTKLSIDAGSYLTHYQINLSNELPNLATGIVRLPDTETAVFDDLKPGWACYATFGKQTLQNDMLGMCIFFRTKDLIGYKEDKYSHVIVLKPENNKLDYYFGAAWEQDVSGVKSMDDFKALLKDQVKFLK